MRRQKEMATGVDVQGLLRFSLRDVMLHNDEWVHCAGERWNPGSARARLSMRKYACMHAGIARRSRSHAKM